MGVNYTRTEIAAEAILSGTPTDIQLAQLGGLPLSVRNTLSTNTVATVSALPAVANNIGRLMYVSATQEYYYSDGFQWVLAGGTSTLARTLFVWGSNTNGGLGDGTTTHRSSPVTTSGGGTDWVRLGNIRAQTAYKANSALWVWGVNSTGALGLSDLINRSSPTAFAMGGSWSQSSRSNNHLGAIRSDGTIWMSGSNSSGQLGDGTTIAKSSPVTTAGGGTIWNRIILGQSYTVATRTDGTLWTWGVNNNGQLGDSTIINKSSPITVSGGGTNWSTIAAGLGHVAAMKTDGTLWSWGWNYAGQVGDNTTIAKSSPVQVSGGGTDWSTVSAGDTFTAALKTDGTLWTWGVNYAGQLGIGTTINRSSPGTVAGGGTNWSQISSGRNQVLALRTNGTLWSWGNNGYGQLGDGTTAHRSSPITVAGGGNNWIFISGGYNMSMALRVEF